jgi:hypothetical protein
MIEAEKCGAEKDGNGEGIGMLGMLLRWIHECCLGVGHEGDHRCGRCVETWPRFVAEEKAE